MLIITFLKMAACLHWNLQHRQR